MVFLLQSLSYTLIHQHSCELSDKSRQGFPGWEGALLSSYSSPIRRLGGLHIPEQRCKGGRLLLARPSPFSTLPASHLEFHSTKLCKAASDPTKTISVPPLVLWGRAGYGVGWSSALVARVCVLLSKKGDAGWQCHSGTVGQWQSATARGNLDLVTDKAAKEAFSARELCNADLFQVVCFQD